MNLHRPLVILVLLSGVALFGSTMTIVGCNGDQTTDSPIADNPGGQKPPANFLPRLEKGLEFQRFVVWGQRSEIINALRPFVLPTKIDSDVENEGASVSEPRPAAGFPEHKRIDVLQENGFRLIAVPIDSLANVIRSMNPEPYSDSTWLGQGSEWIPIASGPAIDGTRILRINNQTQSYNQGRFRILVRSYPIVMPGSKNLIRLEILPQWHLPPRTRLIARPTEERMAGRLFADLGAALNMDGTYAVILLSDDPDADWTDGNSSARKISSVSTTTTTTTTTTIPADEVAKDAHDENQSEPPTSSNPPRSGDQAAGPKAPPVRTIGEETLQSMGGDRQMVIVFIPHVVSTSARSRPADKGIPADTKK